MQSVEVPYLRNDSIEKEAEALLSKFQLGTGPIIGPPIPVDELIDFLGLKLDFDDLESMLGVADVHGALWIDERQIIIDEGLVPEDYPNMQGRFNFTAAHETGHWWLHRDHYKSRASQAEMFSAKPAPQIVCRRSNSRERIELQADRFASYLLMPEEFVRAVWVRRFGPGRIIKLERLRQNEGPIIRSEIFRRGSLPGDRDELDNVLFEWAALEFAEKFGVSAAAMRIRLEGLGLFVRGDAPRQVPLLR